MYLGAKRRYINTLPFLSFPVRLYTKVDAQCDKMATVVGRTKLTTLATVDEPWRNFYKSVVWDRIPEGSAVIVEGTHIPWCRSVGWAEGRCFAKTGSIHSAISIQLWIVVDRHLTIANTALTWRFAGKNWINCRWTSCHEGLYVGRWSHVSGEMWTTVWKDVWIMKWRF